ncbi:MAG: O-methyltransferase [Eubacterium sp.]|nr:O-methyltransferase [Eubacterium sp.]
MDYDRIRTFINSYNRDDAGLLGEIHSEALSSCVPIIRDETREFLKLIITMHKPEHILELGTAVGYSAIIMAEAMRMYAGHAAVTTVELEHDTAETARKNIAGMGLSDFIRVIEGDAAKILESDDLSGENFDMVFIDAAKSQYQNYLDGVLKYVHKGSVIVCDNILMGGEVLDSHFHVEKRDRTIHDKMRKFLYNLKNDSRFVTSIVAIGDGMTVSYVV